MSKHPANNLPENYHEKLTITDLPTYNENIPKVRFDVPTRKGNEAIELADLNTSSPNQGLYFHYDIEKHAGGDNYEDEYVAVEIKDKINAERHGDVYSSRLASPETSDANTREKVLPKNLEPGRIVQQQGQCPTQNSNAFEEINNDASTPKKIPRIFKAPANTEYDDDHYCLGNNEGFDSNQVTVSAQKTKTKGVPWFIGIGTVVIVLLGGAICAALFLQPSEEKKTSNDTGKLF